MESSFDDVGSFYNGLSGKSKDDFGQGSDRFITYMNVYKNTIANPDGCELVLVEDGEHQNRVEYGDILFTQSSETLEEVGLSSVWLHKASPFLNSFCFGFHFKEKGIINPRFIAYGLRTSYMREQIIREGQGATRYNLSSNRLKPIKLVYPSYQEQSKVASLMSCIEKRIEKQQELICTLKKYKRGLLMHYFSDDRTQQWTHYSISQIGKVITGSTPPTNDRSNYDGELLFCSPGDVGEEKYISSTEKRVSPKGFALGRPLPPNSVIVTCIGLIGKLGIATTGMITNQQINALVVSEGFDHEFIYYAFENFFPEYRSKVSMQTLPILSKSEFEKLIIKAPILDVQLKISSHLASMDRRIEHTQKELNLLFEQRRGIIQQLFI